MGAGTITNWMRDLPKNIMRTNQLKSLLEEFNANVKFEYD